MVFFIFLENNDSNTLSIEFGTVNRSVISPFVFISFLENRGPFLHFPRVWPISLSNNDVLETC